jgi:hypothetical protein
VGVGAWARAQMLTAGITTATTLTIHRIALLFMRNLPV